MKSLFIILAFSLLILPNKSYAEIETYTVQTKTLKRTHYIFQKINNICTEEFCDISKKNYKKIKKLLKNFENIPYDIKNIPKNQFFLIKNKNIISVGKNKKSFYQKEE